MQHDVSHPTGEPPAPSLTWAARLRQAGLRVTKQRLAVLHALETLPHATADDALRAVRATLPDMTVQSIYIVLHSLVGVGLARKLDLPDSAARYETRVDDNHHHAVCTHCGRIEDVACAVGHAPCLTPSHDHGISIQIADVVYHGVCKDCRDGVTADGTATP